MHINATLTRSSASMAPFCDSSLVPAQTWSRTLFPSYERQRERERGRMREIDRFRGTEGGQESEREYKTDTEEEALIA